MERAFNLLPKVLHKRGLTHHVSGALIVHRATAWIAEHLKDVSTYICVQKVQDGQLYIECAHSIALQECQAVSDQLLQYLRQECPFAPIKEVRIMRERLETHN